MLRDINKGENHVSHGNHVQMKGVFGGSLMNQDY